jgi:hypothetical protein
MRSRYGTPSSSQITSVGTGRDSSCTRSCQHLVDLVVHDLLDARPHRLDALDGELGGDHLAVDGMFRWVLDEEGALELRAEAWHDQGKAGM